MATRERDITGERIVITGATGGIGLEIARGLARRGAALTIIARNPSKAQAAAAELCTEPGATGLPDVVLGDLASLDSVRRAAAEIRERYECVDVLVNNAGIHNPESRTTGDGFEEMMATNHLGPFLLTNLVRDLLEAGAPARVVVTASEAHRSSGRIDLARLADPAAFGSGPVGAQLAYGRTKLVNILFTQELARRLEGTGVTANCFCPGAVATGLLAENRLLDVGGQLLSRTPLVNRPDQGARLGVRLAVDEELEGVTGRFFTTTPGMRFLPAAGTRGDEDLQRRVWERSAELVGL